MERKEFERIGFAPADILLPADCDWEKWAVVACDQFTSQPEYWDKVEQNAGDAPSAFRLILPELYLSGDDTEDRIKAIHEAMDKYLQDGVFKTYEDAFIYLERVQSDGRVRRGVIGMVDLECYDYNKGSTSLVRATEGTVLERIPPRQAVRREASIELPHIMLLIDDPDNTVIGPLADCSECLYDFDLMEGGGHAAAYLVPDDKKQGVADALNKRLDACGESQLLFAMGDGNHSLATAKACYEELKQEIGAEAAASHPARWALAEVVNLYDDALTFEPIHRVMFDVDPVKVLEGLKEYYPNHKDGADEAAGHVIEYVTEEGNGFITIMDSDSNLPVGTLQKFLDEYLKNNSGSIDYIHDEVAREFGARPNCIAFMLPPMEKDSLFESIISDGALPRKTFSMGHAEDKRYYIEARKIR